MTVNIRTTFQPEVIIPVSDLEYASLFAAGLVYSLADGSPPARRSFTEAQYAEFDDPGSTIRALIAAAAGGANAAALTNSQQAVSAAQQALTTANSAGAAANSAVTQVAAIAPSDGKRAASVDALDWNVRDHGVFTGSSTDQAPAIQAAIVALSAAAAANGGAGQLTFPAGDYAINTGAITGADNVFLVGLPGARLIKASSGSILMNWLGRTNWGIKGFDIDFGTKNYGATSDGFAGWENSLRVTDCTRFTIEGNTFRQGAFAISLRNTAAGTNGLKGCSHGVITRNYFTGTQRDVAVDMLEPVSGGAGVEDIEVSRNVVDSISVGFRAGGKWTAFYVNGGNNLRFERNVVYASEDTGIMINNCTHYWATDNYLRTQQLGIYAGASKYGRIRGNNISSQRDIGIALHARDDVSEPYLAFTSITDNTITQCGRNAITIEGTQNVRVNGNHCEANNLVLTTVKTVTTTPVSLTYRPEGFGNAALVNTGSTTIYVSSDPNVTTSTGTPIAAGATYTYVAGTPAYGVVASGTGTFTTYAEDNYGSVIGAWGIGSRKPAGLIITENFLSKGAGGSLYGISVTDTPNDITVKGNVLLTGFATRFRYGTLGGRYDVQTSNGTSTTNALMTVPAWENLISQTATTAGVLATHLTHGLIISRGGVWKKVADDTTVTP
jgi:parallel beta-helix repeat protein